MKTSGLRTYFQRLIDNTADCDEIGVGLDTMLSHDVVKFLTTDYSRAPLNQCVVSKPNAIFVLDEHELAMV